MRWQSVWAEFRRDRFIQVVAATALALILAAVVGPFVTADPQALHLLHPLAKPSWAGGQGGLLGTDQLGRSVAIRILYGLRTSYVIGVLAVILGGVVGTAMGLLAGYRGGWCDSVIMRVVDLQMSLPAFLIAMALVVTTGGGMWILVLVLGLTAWTMYARIGRALVLRYRTTEFVFATRAIGASSLRVMGRHLFPNIVPTLAAIATIEFARVMLAEAALSFLGFGIQPPQISLGLLLSQSRDYLTTAWWLAVPPGLALAFAVLTLNLGGNWLERVSNPTTNSVREQGPAVGVVAATERRRDDRRDRRAGRECGRSAARRRVALGLVRFADPSARGCRRRLVRHRSWGERRPRGRIGLGKERHRPRAHAPRSPSGRHDAAG